MWVCVCVCHRSGVVILYYFDFPLFSPFPKSISSWNSTLCPTLCAKIQVREYTVENGNEKMSTGMKDDRQTSRKWKAVREREKGKHVYFMFALTFFNLILTPKSFLQLPIPHHIKQQNVTSSEALYKVDTYIATNTLYIPVSMWTFFSQVPLLYFSMSDSNSFNSIPSRIQSNSDDGELGVMTRQREKNFLYNFSSVCIF